MFRIWTWSACLSLASSLTVEVSPGSSECFSLKLDKGASLSGNFEVLTEGFNLDALDVKVAGPAPKKTAHYAASGLEEGSFSAEAADTGEHSLCLTNTDSGAAATLGFAFRADADLLNSEIATEENVKSMVEVANELTQGLDMLADHQEFMRVREAAHAETVVSTNDKVMWWSVAEAAALAAMSVWQVLYIRTFFETKRSI